MCVLRFKQKTAYGMDGCLEFRRVLVRSLRVGYDTAQKTADLLKIYRQGLNPQARAEFQAGLAAYENNRQDFEAVLTAFLDVLHLDEEYWQNLSDRETALARIEEITGLSVTEEATRQ